MSEYAQSEVYTCIEKELERYAWKDLHLGKRMEIEEERGIFVHLLFMFLSLNLHACVIKKTISTGKTAI